jgi:hypothetical protein
MLGWLDNRSDRQGNDCPVGTMMRREVSPPKQCFVACPLEARCECREWAARVHAVLDQQGAIRAACARLRNSERLCDCRDYGPVGIKPCRAAVEAARLPTLPPETSNPAPEAP